MRRRKNCDLLLLMEINTSINIGHYTYSIAPLFNVSRFTVTHFSAPHFTVSHWTVPHCTLPHCTLPHCTVSNCIVPDCPVQHCTVHACIMPNCTAIVCRGWREPRNKTLQRGRICGLVLYMERVTDQEGRAAWQRHNFQKKFFLYIVFYKNHVGL